MGTTEVPTRVDRGERHLCGEALAIEVQAASLFSLVMEQVGPNSRAVSLLLKKYTERSAGRSSRLEKGGLGVQSVVEV